MSNKVKIIIRTILTLTMCGAVVFGVNTTMKVSARYDPYASGSNFWTLSDEEKAREIFIMQEIDREEAVANAPAGSTIVITTKDDINTLSNQMMQQLVKHPTISLDMTFKYDGKTYNVVIPAGKAVDDKTEWYGPLYLIGKYGGRVVE